MARLSHGLLFQRVEAQLLPRGTRIKGATTPQPKPHSSKVRAAAAWRIHQDSQSKLTEAREKPCADWSAVLNLGGFDGPWYFLPIRPYPEA